LGAACEAGELQGFGSDPRTPVRARNSTLHPEAGQMAASDHMPIFFKNRLHLVGRPQMSPDPRPRTDAPLYQPCPGAHLQNFLVRPQNYLQKHCKVKVLLGNGVTVAFQISGYPVDLIQPFLQTSPFLNRLFPGYAYDEDRLIDACAWARRAL
jgi:hypothetical protein